MQPAITELSFMHGFSGLVVGYFLTGIPLVIELVRNRAPASTLLRSPFWTILAVIAGAIINSVLSFPLDALASPVNPLRIGFAMLVLWAVGFISGRLLARYPSDTPRHRRGAVVSEGVRSSRAQRLSDFDVRATCDPDTPVTLAGVSVSAEDETKHFKFIGTTGTGKSTAIREVLGAALARGDRAVITDPDGGYLANFYRPDRGDVILNPFDPGSRKWDLLGEINEKPDVDQLARSLIPEGSASERSWTDYARTFFIAVTHRARQGGIKDDRELYRLVGYAPAEEIKRLVANSPAAPFLEEGAEKMFGSLRGVAASALRVLDYTTSQDAPPFSVRQWIREGAARRNGGAGGVLFLPYKAGEIAALRSVISAWMRIAIFEAMNRREGDQRLWFVVDELDALGEIDGLKDALARLRKFGGRAILGFQSIAQVSAVYGKDSDTIVENCGTTLILRCSASERGGTSQFASRLIGQREVIHTTRSRTRGPSDWFSSTTKSEHLNIEPAVMPSEIERLPDLEGFLKFASQPDWERVRLSTRHYPTIERPPRAAHTDGAVGTTPPVDTLRPLNAVGSANVAPAVNVAPSTNAAASSKATASRSSTVVPRQPIAPQATSEVTPINAASTLKQQKQQRSPRKGARKTGTRMNGAAGSGTLPPPTEEIRVPPMPIEPAAAARMLSGSVQPELFPNDLHTEPGTSERLDDFPGTSK